MKYRACMRNETSDLERKIARQLYDEGSIDHESGQGSHTGRYVAIALCAAALLAAGGYAFIRLYEIAHMNISVPGLGG